MKHKNILRSQKGFALVITLLITAILVGLVVEIVYGVYISTSMVNNFKDSQRASLLARAGVDMAKAGLEEFLKLNPHITMEAGGMNFTHREGDGVVEMRLLDEQGKASLKIVYPATGASNEKVYNIYLGILKYSGQDEYLADTLADWIDMNDEARIGGAEGVDYYQALPHPYQPKNDYLDSLEELLMIKGYTPKIYKTLNSFITVYTDGLININTAGKEVLLSLSDEMSETLVQRIIDYRKETPFRSKSDIMKVTGFETTGFSLQNKITVQSNIYRVYSKAAVGEVIREVEAVVEVGGGLKYWREM